MSDLVLAPITLKAANEFVGVIHRHHGRSVGHKFSISVQDGDGAVRAVVIVGRPVARAFDDGWTAEATRLCSDGTPNTCSMLYAAAWRAAKGMGYRRCITYTLASEPGTSLHAAGWVVDGHVRGRSWSTPSRPRDDKHPLEDKVRWRAGAPFQEVPT